MQDIDNIEIPLSNEIDNKNDNTNQNIESRPLLSLNDMLISKVDNKEEEIENKKPRLSMWDFFNKKGKK